MSTSTVPSPTFGYLYPSTALSGITGVSSRWDVLKAFLAASDGAIVSRLRELPTGLLIITSIPGRPHSGAIYFYSSVRRAIFMLDWAGRDDDFEAEEFDVLVEAFSLDLALASGTCPATRHRSRRHGRDRQHHPRSTGAARWADDENGTTRAQAQAFRRACAEFGLGRYLRELEGWSCKVPVNAKGYFKRPHFSVLPDSAIHPSELAEAQEVRARAATSSRKSAAHAPTASAGSGQPVRTPQPSASSASTNSTPANAIEAQLALLRTPEVKQRLAGYLDQISDLSRTGPQQSWPPIPRQRLPRLVEAH